MNIITMPLAAMAGGVLGAAIHETIHYALARALGEVLGVGWTGGLSGGPYVDFRVPASVGNWRSELVRKGPLGVGLLGAIAFAFTYDGLSLGSMALAGLVAGILWTSPEDLFADAAAQSDQQPDSV
ncbi:MAG: hypothetical protein RI560_05650 [Natronomonas sp.]|nr:hypothetical protein [Natronomonas sp.]